MNSTFTDAAVTIVGLIIGVAALSVILSPKSKTAQVIQAAASGLGNNIAAATAPVTSAATKPNLTYPGADFGLGLPGFM